MFGKGIIIWCSFVWLLLSCSKSNVDLDIPVLAHAGQGLYNPQGYFHHNSKEAIEYALSFKELHGIEMDVQLSKDGTFWLFHDQFLENSTTGTGQICEKSDQELEGLIYQSLKKEKLVPLSEIEFENYSGEKDIFLDIKTIEGCAYDSIFVDELLSIVNSLPILQLPQYNVKLILNNTKFTHAFHAQGFELYTDVVSFEQAQNDFSNYPYAGCYIRNENIDELQIRELIDLGKKVVIFGVRTLHSIREAKSKLPSYILVEEFKKALMYN